MFDEYSQKMRMSVASLPSLQCDSQFSIFKKKRLSLNELDQYISEEVEVEECDVANYWKSRLKIFPVLYSMAIDYLSIQSTSVASERAFSASGNLITDLRCSMGSDTIEACMSLGNWWSTILK